MGEQPSDADKRGSKGRQDPAASDMPVHQVRQLRQLMAARVGYVLPDDFRAFIARQALRLVDDCQLGSVDGLVQRLREEAESSALWRRFISRMTIGESYLFRNPNHMQMLREVILPALLERAKRRRVYIWSAGCARGEEPYTLAILLHELSPKLASTSVQIIATDIDTEALEDAHAANYRAWAFRQTPYYIHRKYFTAPSTPRFVLRRATAQLVTFHYHHLAQPPETPIFPEVGFDLILCRNVLMYMRPDFRESAAQTMARMMTRDGLLLLGQVEAMDYGSGLLERHFVRSSTLYTRSDATDEPFRLLQDLGHTGAESRGTHVSSEVPLLDVDDHSSAAQASSFARGRALTPPAGSPLPDRDLMPFSDEPPLISEAWQPGRRRVGASVPDLDSALAVLPETTGGDDVGTTSVEDDLAETVSDQFEVLTASELYDTVRALMYAGQTQEAQRYCEALIAANPLESEHHCLLALVMLEARDADAALKALRSALYCDPDSLTAYYLWWLVGVRFHGPRWERTRWAKRHLERLLSEIPDDHRVPLLSGVSAGDIRYLLQQKWDSFQT